MSKTVKIILLVLGVLLIDQVLKIYIKTNFQYGEDMPLFGANWAYFNFVENNGMAFGLSLGGEYGKLALSLFRIFAIGGIGWYLNHLVKNKAHVVLVSSIAFIFAGAMGNIIDSTFYGVIFSSSEFQLASLFPAEGGYSSLLHGKVVDMFYFPILKGNFPDWVPFWGGDYFIFFRPVFNIADASISVGVILILLFQGVIFKEKTKI